jgi:hypothetical protein
VASRFQGCECYGDISTTNKDAIRLQVLLAR